MSNPDKTAPHKKSALAEAFHDPNLELARAIFIGMAQRIYSAPSAPEQKKPDPKALATLCFRLAEAFEAASHETPKWPLEAASRPRCSTTSTTATSSAPPTRRENAVLALASTAYIIAGSKLWATPFLCFAPFTGRDQWLLPAVERRTSRSASTTWRSRLRPAHMLAIRALERQALGALLGAHRIGLPLPEAAGYSARQDLPGDAPPGPTAPPRRAGAVEPRASRPAPLICAGTLPLDIKRSNSRFE
jgi:hypothetical protein